MKRSPRILMALALFCVPTTFTYANSSNGAGDNDAARIRVHAGITRAIGGVAEVDRARYFSVSDHGTGFDQRVPEEIYEYLVHDLGISFGRQLGPVKWTASTLPEDPKRPGYADVTKLENQRLPKPGAQFVKDFGPNLNVAAHGNHNAYPEYMGQYALEGANYHGKTEWVPENIDAAVELAAAVFKYNYNDFDRPKFYEPLNEPHWKFFGDPHFAEWHMAIQKRFHEDLPEVKVGGMCQSVSYFYRDNYQNFNGMKVFYDRTEGEMDFYSFHSYDYFDWTEEDFRGRVQSGLPLEGNLDLLQNYAVLEHGKEVEVVISEQGGYINVQPKGEYDGELLAAKIAEQYFPEDTWENELKKRSVVAFVHVSSIIANTLAFMDHPHTVQKSVPFLLPSTWKWDTKYYASLYVPENYTDESKWVPTHMLDFYKLFRGVDGRRVYAASNDPDLQTRAFVDGSKLYLVINNQSWRSEAAEIQGIMGQSVEIRRFGRNDDYTAYYEESQSVLEPKMEIAGRETVVIVADYGPTIEEKTVLNERSFYGDKTRTKLSENANYTIEVPAGLSAVYGVLRVGMTRPSGLSHDPQITLNGKVLEVPLEDAADRFDVGEYGTTKMIVIPPVDLKTVNVVKVRFPDGDAGAVGSAVLRIAVRE
ncbi:MAG: beta-agarase [Lentimonas sp.]